ncbi:MAG TPA: hypothetical protein VFC51_03220, partial [Chloroflexota bacterium]|nr:hypothetical protein [Chloroflexota bacterium]
MTERSLQGEAAHGDGAYDEAAFGEGAHGVCAVWDIPRPRGRSPGPRVLPLLDDRYGVGEGVGDRVAVTVAVQICR